MKCNFQIGEKVGFMDDRYIAGYMRISDDDEDLGEGKKESNSIENQRKLIESYVERHEELSLYPLKEFADDGVSGVNFNRPGVQRLLKEIKENRIQCVVVKDLSRFGRNYIEAGDYIEQIFPFLGVRFISIADNFDSFKNPAGIEIGLKNLIHDLYSRDLSKKIKSTKALMQKQGVYSGGGVPFGYIRDDGNGKTSDFIPDPEAAQVVRQIFTLAADGNTTTKIADILNKKDIPTPGAYKREHEKIRYQMKNDKRNLWTSSQISLIIQNEVYLGTFVSHKLSTVKPGVVRKIQESEYVKLENHHDKLIEKEIFQKAQKVISTGKKRKNRKDKENKNPSPLRGKIKCGCCGYGMSFKPSVKKPYYYCRMGDSCGSHMRIDSNLMENIVWDILQKMIEVCHEKEKVMQGEQMQILSAISGIQEKKRALEIRTEHCRISRLELYHQWKEGKITKEEYITRKKESSSDEAEYQKELEQLSQRLSDILSLQKQIEQKSGLAMFVGVQNLTKELSDELIERIEVYDNGRVEIKWKIKDVME